MQDMEREPMVIGARNPGIDQLREATQAVRAGLRVELNSGWHVEDTWDSLADFLQTLDEGSLGVVDFVQ